MLWYDTILLPPFQIIHWCFIFWCGPVPSSGLDDWMMGWPTNSRTYQLSIPSKERENISHQTGSVGKDYESNYNHIVVIPQAWITKKTTYPPKKTSSRWWFQKFVIFIPTKYLGKWFDLTNLFADGWFNHQQVIIYTVFFFPKKSVPTAFGQIFKHVGGWKGWHVIRWPFPGGFLSQQVAIYFCDFVCVHDVWAIYNIRIFPGRVVTPNLGLVRESCQNGRKNKVKDLY